MSSPFPPVQSFLDRLRNVMGTNGLDVDVLLVQQIKSISLVKCTVLLAPKQQRSEYIGISSRFIKHEVELGMAVICPVNLQNTIEDSFKSCYSNVESIVNVIMKDIANKPYIETDSGIYQIAIVESGQTNVKASAMCVFETTVSLTRYSLIT